MTAEQSAATVMAGAWRSWSAGRTNGRSGARDSSFRAASSGAWSAGWTGGRPDAREAMFRVRSSVAWSAGRTSAGPRDNDHIPGSMCAPAPTRPHGAAVARQTWTPTWSCP